MTDNSFIREVDEAVRQERYKRLWDRFGIYVIGLALALVVGAAAYNIWKYLAESAAETAGDAFTAAIALKNANDQEQATKAFEELVKDGPSGYSILSRFQLASSQAKAGDVDKAIEAYDGLAKDRRVDPILKGLATLQAAALRLDKADYSEMQTRLDALANGNSAWRFSAKELLGLSAYQNNDLRAAEDQFSALLVDAGTPRNMRDRANVILALIISQTAAEGGSSAESPKTDDTKTDDVKANEATTN
ncbi:MAG: tetratricopeptide repeat protein [Methyloceanibacter sp.]|nr:tetratricopeptide repeat protein [Methyloceanibacter sp.]